jgi:hypothetical protein
MLRYVVGDSAVFFNLLRGYSMDTANFRYKSSATVDFAAKISQIAGYDLTWFIDEWIMQPNHPVYGNIYQFVTLGGGYYGVGFQAIQTQSNTPFHRMPLEVRITFASGPDTTFRVSNTFNNQFWWWTFNRQPTAFAFDPNNDIVLKQGTTNPGIVPTSIVNIGNEVPDRFALLQNYPNPFNPATKIRFAIPSRSVVELKVYDAAGRLVSTIHSGTVEPGNYAAEFNASDHASGVYYYELTAVSDTKGTFRDVKKMVVLK